MNNITESAVFPLVLPLHLVFVALAVIYFSYRFITTKQPYQITMMIAMVATLALRLIPNSTEANAKIVYIVVGLAEIILIVLSAVLGIKSTIKAKKEIKLENEKEAENSCED